VIKIQVQISSSKLRSNISITFRSSAGSFTSVGTFRNETFELSKVFGGNMSSPRPECDPAKVDLAKDPGKVERVRSDNIESSFRICSPVPCTYVNVKWI
jgi:hypothetical protein